MPFIAAFSQSAWRIKEMDEKKKLLHCSGLAVLHKKNVISIPLGRKCSVLGARFDLKSEGLTKQRRKNIKDITNIYWRSAHATAKVM